MNFQNKLILAPLAGITDSVFRRICRRHGADITWSEMVSADGLVHGTEKNARLLKFTDEERPLGIQLFGADPQSMGRAAGLAAKLEPDFIDLNFGCPVPKVVRKNGGVALMREPRLIGKIAAEAVRQAAGVPVTAKIRSGWDSSSINFLEVAGILIDSGVAALTLHPRTRVQGFSGRSDWSRIAELVKFSPVPVIGSGDIFSPRDALAMFSQTGCRAVMIGRGALGNPWIFGRARRLLENLSDPGEPQPGERFAQALEQAEMMAGEMGELAAIILMRKHFSYYTRGLAGGAALRRELFACIGLEQARLIFEHYPESMQCTPI